LAIVFSGEERVKKKKIGQPRNTMTETRQRGKKESDFKIFCVAGENMTIKGVLNGKGEQELPARREGRNNQAEGTNRRGPQKRIFSINTLLRYGQRKTMVQEGGGTEGWE